MTALGRGHFRQARNFPGIWEFPPCRSGPHSLDHFQKTPGAHQLREVRALLLAIAQQDQEVPRKLDRNRRMFTAFAQGRTLEQLGEEHALTCQRVRAVLIDEKNRRNHSVEPFYRSLRGA